ncbi:MAG: hypothetical protein HKN43_02305 [Rhodothermales bacterium]|nr:hypothetical protein [Rhodothermales bacterium]
MRHWIVYIAILGYAGTAHAQLISPGKLTKSHASLEGVTNCTSCHDLGTRGVSAKKCLDCHTPLNTRIFSGIGYHSTIVSQNCGTCHKEHFGTAFDAIRFDTTSFVHDDAGFTLLSSHAEIGCRDCHTPDNITDEAVIRFKSNAGRLDQTYLGLNPICASCHADSDPHQSQFAGRDCASCHDESKWDTAPEFSHDSARFPLLGKHVEVACVECHTTDRNLAGVDFTLFKPIASGECGDCHADPHSNSFGANCSTCHSENGFRSIKRLAFEKTFDHSATSFDLIGQHATIACGSCHTRGNTESISIRFASGESRKSYPKPIVDDCESCHVDYHRNVFANSPGGAVCSNCHTEDGWAPTTFDLERHNRQSGFQLVGAHAATPCTFCHESAGFAHSGGPFTFEQTDCLTCHENDNVHGSGLLEIANCETCHTEDSWTESIQFDHSVTEFALQGQHLSVSCADCHVSSADTDKSLIIFDAISDSCINCHESDDPHQGQFLEASCGDCHDASSFFVQNFDHDNTSFPLTSAHTEVACQSCHLEEESLLGFFTRFKPLSSRCEDCHR